MKHLVFCALQKNRIKPACIDNGFFMFFFPGVFYLGCWVILCQQYNLL